MNTVYASVNLSKKLKAVLKSGTAFLVETDDIDSGRGRISFEVRDGIDPSVVAALGASSVSIEAVNRAAPPPAASPDSEPNYPISVVVEEPPQAVEERSAPPPEQKPSVEDFVPTEDLVGGAKPVANFSAKKVVKKEAAPQNQAKQPPPKQPPQPAVQAQPAAPKQPSIMNEEQFYNFLDTVKYDPTVLDMNEKPMSRSEAVKAEKTGSIGSGVSMYVVNTAGCQLVIDDLNIRLLKDSGFNLGSIPAAKLKASTHLYEALRSGAIKFVSREVADKARMRALKRQEAITRGEDSREIYDKADDVFDEIESGAVDDAAVNAVPQHLRSAASIDISGDDDYETELDLIQSAVESREAQFEADPPSAEDVPGRRVVERETR